MAPSLGVAASLLLLPSALAAGLYTKNSPVVQVDGRSYDSLIAKSNHTSIVEFYAPWCGHCKNLQPAYEKAAKSLAGLAKVAAVNCDDESNKPFCGSMGVQGFPTLKIVKPGRIKDGKKGKPIVEDYQGPRTAKSIVDAVIDKIPNHVKRLSDKDYEAWLDEGNGPKAVLFSDKSSTSATLKAIAVDFLGGISVAQIRDKEKQAVQVFAVEKFPTLVLLPGDGKDPVTYEGDMKKEPMVAFLSQAATPNPDPAPKKSKAKSTSSKDKTKPSSSKGKATSSEASCPYSKSGASQVSEEAKTAKPSQTLEDLEDDSQPTESPDPDAVEEDAPKPVKIPEAAPAIPQLLTSHSVQRACLNSKAGTCILVFPPTSDDATATSPVSQAMVDLSEIHYKHVKSERSLFPFYQLARENPDSINLRTTLKLAPSEANVDIVAVNGKRGWYRQYAKPTISRYDLEEWIDAIRMGDGAKEKLPDAVVVDAADLPVEKVKLNMNDPEGVRKALEKEKFQEGVDFEMEEIDDAQYEQLLAEARAGAAARKAAEEAQEGKARDEL